MREARLAEREERCGHCDKPRSACSDPKKAWYPQREICYASMEREAANATWARLHDAEPWHDGTFRNWAKEPSALHPYHRDHGVSIGVSEVDVRPHDKFLTHASWGPDQMPVDDDVIDELDDETDDWG